MATTLTSGGGKASFTLSEGVKAPEFGSVYFATITSPTEAIGSITLLIGAQSVTDGTRGAPEGKVRSSAITFDTTTPELISKTPKDGQTPNEFVIDVVFSKPVTGLEPGDITVTLPSGTVGAPTITISGSAENYTVTITPPTDVNGSIKVVLDKETVTDGVRTGPKTEQTLLQISQINTTAPTVSFTEPAGTQVTNTFDVPITFSKSVTGFAASDITVTTTPHEWHG